MEEIKKIKEGILYLLQFDESFTLIDIRDYLKLNAIDVPIRMLRKVLEELEDEHLIKERHFDAVRDGRVDYSLEHSGDLVLNNKKEEKEMHKIWKLPDFDNE